LKLTVASMFRNSTPYLGRYFSQIEGLRLLGHDIHLIVAEGDSTDDTYASLDERLRPSDKLLKVDHGGRHYGSIDHPARWADIAKVATAITAEFSHLSDAFIWVESDLVWNFSAMSQLLADLETVPAVAPMVMAGDSTRFYDTYGFRKNGQRFLPTPPYHPELDGQLTRIDSCGSCFVLSPPAFRHLDTWDGIWPFRCSDLWIDPNVAIRHP
jgi:hypothetical protein